MALPAGLPVVDHHCHLSPTGEGVRAGRRFRSAGGTHLFLTTQNYGNVHPRALEDYRRQFETTEALARQLGTEAEVVAYVVVAPYPVDLVAQTAEQGLRSAVELQRAALDLAGEWVRERRAVALGEVGRPHFDVPAEIAQAADVLFRHALDVAREADCPVVVHSEDLDAAGYRLLAEQARAAGVPPGRVVKHYARSRLALSERPAVTPSYVARRDLVRTLWTEPGPWFLETDFLDDPARPGAVLDIATVPRRAAELVRGSPAAVERLWTPFVESVEEVYGFRPDAPSRGGA